MGVVPTLRRFFAIYTDGAGLPELGRPPPGMAVEVSELLPLVAPGPQDELFGPAAAAFARFTPRRGFLVSLAPAELARVLSPTAVDVANDR